MNRAEEVVTVAVFGAIFALCVFLFGVQVGFEMAMK